MTDCSEPAVIVVMADMIFQSQLWNGSRNEAVELAKEIVKVLEGKK